MYGALAQLGARHTGSVEVTGSSPVCSILEAIRLCGFFSCEKVEDYAFGHSAIQGLSKLGLNA